MQEGLDAIAHPGRRAMLTLLLGGERSAGDLADHAGMRQPVASQHLRVLRDAGLVTVRKDGNRRLYSIDFDTLARLRRDLDAFWQTKQPSSTGWAGTTSFAALPPSFPRSSTRTTDTPIEERSVTRGGDPARQERLRPRRGGRTRRSTRPPHEA